MTHTLPEIATMVRERLMTRTASEHFEMGCPMFAAARNMALPSKARFEFRWEDQFNLGLDPERAREFHDEIATIISK